MLITISAIVFALMCISLCVNTRKVSLSFQGASCLAEALYNTLISSYTVATLNVICFVRALVYMRRNHYSALTNLIILIVFMTLLIAGCIITWNGLVSIWLLPATLLRSYCLWQKDMKLIRLSGALSGFLHVTYYVAFGAWLIAAGWLLTFIVSTHGYYTKDFCKKKKSKHAISYHRRLRYL